MEDEVFTSKKTLPVRFFYNMPEDLRFAYENIFEYLLSKKDFDWLKQHKSLIKIYMKNISPEKFIQIRDHAPDFDYFVFCEIFQLLQPIIGSIVENYNLYEKYPEYLI